MYQCGIYEKKLTGCNMCVKQVKKVQMVKVVIQKKSK